MKEINIDNLVIAVEHLSFEVVYDYLIETRSDFPDLYTDFIVRKRSEKLSTLAKFITCRSFNNGQLIGLIAFYMNRPPLCYITHVSIINEYKGLGLFKRLLDYLESISKENKCNLLQLEVLTNNKVAIHTYTRCGFNQTIAKSIDSFYMEKYL